MKIIAPAIPPFAKEFEPCIIKDEVITFLEEPTPMLTPPPEYASPLEKDIPPLVDDEDDPEAIWIDPESKLPIAVIRLKPPLDAVLVLSPVNISTDPPSVPADNVILPAFERVINAPSCVDPTAAVISPVELLFAASPVVIETSPELGAFPVCRSTSPLRRLSSEVEIAMDPPPNN